MKTDEEEFLKSYNQNNYERPSVATDMVVFTIVNKETADYRKLADKDFSVMLIRRGKHPYKHDWALPGGFVRNGENVEETAYRELNEETGVKDISLSQLHVFSDPERDPRGWIISSSFMALANSDKFNLKSGDDAIDARWFSIKFEADNSNELTRKKYNLELTCDDIVLSAVIEKNTTYKRKIEYNIIEVKGIAFDHAKIIAFAILHLRNNLNSSMLAFELLPEYFTLTELQTVYETILDQKLLKANFRRKISDYVIETDMIVEGAGHRPAKQYKQNLQKLLADI